MLVSLSFASLSIDYELPWCGECIVVNDDNVKDVLTEAGHSPVLSPLSIHDYQAVLDGAVLGELIFPHLNSDHRADHDNPVDTLELMENRDVVDDRLGLTGSRLTKKSPSPT